MGRLPSVKGYFWDRSPLPPAGRLGNNPGMRAIKLSADAIPAAREIHRRMIARNLGQKSLALTAGVNETYVRDLFQGKSQNPKLNELVKIAQALDCTILDLVDSARADQVKDGENTAKTASELGLLRIWRRASPGGRARITGAIETAMLGDLPGFGKAEDV